jgi:catechol-2,3-dioxygenase
MSNETETAVGDIPSLFRLNIEIGNLDEAAAFYETLLGIDGRRQAGSRVYFTCGAVTLQVVDVSSAGTPHPAAKALYFTVNDLDAIFERAKQLDCLSKYDVHGVSSCEDPWKNPLCFVEAGTVYPG